MAVPPVIAFLTDVNVPDSVGDWLIERGHDVVRVRDIMPVETPDPVVAETAIESVRVLVTWDKGFNAQRFQAPRFAALHRVAFACEYPLATTRLEALIDRIEGEWAQANEATPLLLRIGRDRIMIRC